MEAAQEKDIQMIIKIHNYGRIPAKKNRMRIYKQRMIKDKSVRTFEAMLKQRAIEIMTLIGHPVIEGPVKLHLDVTFGDRRRRDLQNLFGVWGNPWKEAWRTACCAPQMLQHVLGEPLVMVPAGP